MRGIIASLEGIRDGEGGDKAISWMTRALGLKDKRGRGSKWTKEGRVTERKKSGRENGNGVRRMRGMEGKRGITGCWGV